MSVIEQSALEGVQRGVRERPVRGVQSSPLRGRVSPFSLRCEAWPGVVGLFAGYTGRVRG